MQELDFMTQMPAELEPAVLNAVTLEFLSGFNLRENNSKKPKKKLDPLIIAECVNWMTPRKIWLKVRYLLESESSCYKMVKKKGTEFVKEGPFLPKSWLQRRRNRGKRFLVAPTQSFNPHQLLKRKVEENIRLTWTEACSNSKTKLSICKFHSFKELKFCFESDRYFWKFH